MNRILSVNVDHGWPSVEKVLALLYKLDVAVCLLQDVPFETGRKQIASKLKRKCGNGYAIYYPNEQTIDVSSIFKVDNIILVRKSNLHFRSRIDGYDNSKLISLFGLELAFKVEGQEKTISIFSIYIRPEAEESEVTRALNWISANNPSPMEDTFILGDFNAYNIAWSEPRPLYANPRHGYKYRRKNRGKLIYDWSRENYLTILNDIREGPTCHIRYLDKVRTSFVDIAMAGERAATLLSQFSLYDIQSGNEHRAIILNKADKIRADKISLRLDRLHEFKGELEGLNHFVSNYSGGNTNQALVVNELANEFVTRFANLQDHLTEINGVPASESSQQQQSSGGQSEGKRELDEHLPGLERLEAGEKTEVVEIPRPVKQSIVPVTQHEVDHVFSLLFPSTRHYEPDELDHQLFAAVYGHLRGLIHRICNLSFMYAVYPSVCKRKLGKLVDQEDGSFLLIERPRPLSLILDSIANLRFLNLIESKDMINCDLFDYPLNSKHDLLASILLERRKFEDSHRRNANSRMTTINLRFKNSYESIQHATLIDYLRKDFGTSPIVTWIIEYLGDCTIRISDDIFESGLFKLTAGLLRGSPLADSLWIHLMNSLRRENFSPEMEKFRVLIHQDNIFIIYHGTDKRHTKKFLEMLEDRFSLLNLELAFNECSYRWAGGDANLPIEFCGRMIKQVDSIKILGIPLGSWLTRLNKIEVIGVCRKYSPGLIDRLEHILTSDSPNVAAEAIDFINRTLVPSLLEPVLSILPISHAAMRKYANVIGEIIKEVVAVPIELSQWALRPMFGVSPIEFLILEFLVTRISEVPTPELVEPYSSLIEKLDPAYHRRFDLDTNMASLKRIMSRRRCRYPIHTRPINHEEDRDLLAIKQFFKQILDNIRPECEAHELRGLRAGLCSNYSTWAKYPLKNVKPEHSLVLSGYCLDGERGISKLEPGKMPPGCSSRECLNNRSNIILHRLYDCPKFSLRRALFEKELGVPSGSTLEQYVPEALVDEEKNVILMDYLHSIGFK